MFVCSFLCREKIWCACTLAPRPLFILISFPRSLIFSCSSDPCLLEPPFYSEIESNVACNLTILLQVTKNVWLKLSTVIITISINVILMKTINTVHSQY